jgi:tRNA modification GTPase
MRDADDTLVARLTPPAAGAIATLALHGPAAFDVLAGLFQPVSAKTPEEFFRELRTSGGPGQFWLGRLGEAAGSQDQVVLALKSLEPVPSFEVHCHGGLQVLDLLEEALAARGARRCSWQELTLRLTGDPIRVAALEQLAATPTARTAAILLDQYHGALRGALAVAGAHLAEQRTEEAAKTLEELAQLVPLGKHLTEPWRVAVAGAPNVGKSSLINRLAGFQRSVVAPTPGTTRDLVSVRIALDGWPVELLDMAGIREGADLLESQGIDLAHSAMAGADLCLWLVDASQPPIWPAAWSPKMLFVTNKIDLPPAWDLSQAREAVRVSAATGAGLEELCAVIVGRLVPAVPPEGAAVPFTPRLSGFVFMAREFAHAQRWDDALQVLRRALEESHAE